MSVVINMIRFRRFRLSAKEAHRRMASGEKFMVVDVRTGPEHRGPDGRIPGAVLMPLREFREKGRDLVSRSELPVLLVCSHGVRSMAALAMVAGRGAEAYSLSGGMKAWNRLGFEVIREEPPGSPVPSRKEC